MCFNVCECCATCVCARLFFPFFFCCFVFCFIIYLFVYRYTNTYAHIHQHLYLQSFNNYSKVNLNSITRSYKHTHTHRTSERARENHRKTKRINRNKKFCCHSLKFLPFIKQFSTCTHRAHRVSSHSRDRFYIGFVFLRVLVHLFIRISISFYEFTSSHSVFFCLFSFIECAIGSRFQYDMTVIQHVSAMMCVWRMDNERDRHKQTFTHTDTDTSAHADGDSEKSALN